MKQVMNKDIMRAAGFGKQVELTEQGICPMCEKPVNISKLRDQASRKEYEISGLCQSCQDEIFG